MVWSGISTPKRLKSFAWRCTGRWSAILLTITCASSHAPATLFSMDCDGLVAVFTKSGAHSEQLSADQLRLFVQELNAPESEAATQKEDDVPPGSTSNRTKTKPSTIWRKIAFYRCIVSPHHLRAQHELLQANIAHAYFLQTSSITSNCAGMYS